MSEYIAKQKPYVSMYNGWNHVLDCYGNEAFVSRDSVLACRWWERNYDNLMNVTPTTNPKPSYRKTM